MARSIRLLDLGEVSALRSQTGYHAVAYAMTEGSPDSIILVSPSQAYVCIGYHQDAEKEIDLAYCRSHRLPVIRREVGGGAVYLDRDQVFTQWVFQPDHLPVPLERLFEFFVRPLVKTYQALGINAYYRPINDVHVEGKKIGGSGAAKIGQSMVVVGSLMLDFDRASMARVLKVSSEKMRDKIFESLEQYMTSMRDQLGKMPDREAVKDLYIQNCAEVLEADIVPGAWTSTEETMAVELERRFTSDEWLFQGGGFLPAGVKIHESVRVVEGAYKAPGGLIRVTARLREERIESLSISGDFTMLPASAVVSLEQAVRDLRPERSSLASRLQEVYQSLDIQSPGVTLEHLTEAIISAVGDGSNDSFAG